jgi:hypothetical protein
MKTKRIVLTAMALVMVLSALSACRSDGGERETSAVEWQTADVIGIYPSETRDPDETIVFPDPPETNLPAPSDKLVTLSGTVVEYVAQEPMENVLAVKAWDYTAGMKKIYHLYIGEDVGFVEEFCVGDYVSFTYDPAAEPMDSYDGVPIWTAIRIWDEEMVEEKPVIYLYPEAPTEVSVKLTLDGELTCTYPAYGDGWDNFTAYPDGTLISPDGKEYYCLYWEGKQNTVWDFSRGFCVKGEDTAEFLEWALAAQGLTPREANEFIIYWLPRMEGNAYNVISFQTTAYTDTAVLEITPAPDTLIRVFMAYVPSPVAVNIPAQEFAPVERVGFTAVEWGGTEISMP